jgi:hypothetical protein
MPGHSRSKNGVASLAYVPAIPLGTHPRPADQGFRVVTFWNNEVLNTRTP